ncbi:unnamed protein product, partial [Meganyctiphanes norvegica]
GVLVLVVLALIVVVILLWRRSRASSSDESIELSPQGNIRNQGETGPMPRSGSPHLYEDPETGYPHTYEDPDSGSPHLYEEPDEFVHPPATQGTNTSQNEQRRAHTYQNIGHGPPSRSDPRDSVDNYLVF